MLLIIQSKTKIINDKSDIIKVQMTKKLKKCIYYKKATCDISWKIVINLISNKLTFMFKS